MCCEAEVGRLLLGCLAVVSKKKSIDCTKWWQTLNYENRVDAFVGMIQSWWIFLPQIHEIKTEIEASRNELEDQLLEMLSYHEGTTLQIEDLMKENENLLAEIVVLHRRGESDP